MKISVIIACRNEERTLAETLEGVAAQEWDQPWEVLFADNGSTDGSRAIFERFAAGRPDWRLIDAGGQARQVLRHEPRHGGGARAGGALLRRRRRAGAGLARGHGPGARDASLRRPAAPSSTG